MVPLAKELFNQGYLKSQDDGDVNFKKLKRNMLKVCKPLCDENPLLTDWIHQKTPLDMMKINNKHWTD